MRKNDSFYRRLLCFSALSLCLSFAAGCATSAGFGKAQAEIIERKIDAAKRVLANPNATPAERKAAENDLESAKKDARTLGSAHDKAETRAESNERYRAMLCGAGYLSFLLIAGGFILWRIRKASPV